MRSYGYMVTAARRSESYGARLELVLSLSLYILFLICFYTEQACLVFYSSFLVYQLSSLRDLEGARSIYDLENVCRLFWPRFE